MRKELLKGLTVEQMNKALECNSPEEILELAKGEGVELSEEQLEAVSGGCGGKTKCKKCGSTNVKEWYTERADGTLRWHARCRDCGNEVSEF